MSDWVYLNHPDTDAEPARVPDEPDVVAYYEARGWQKVDAPEAVIFVPQPSEASVDTDAYGVAWVTLQHAETGALHRFPADAADGLRDDGWYPVDKPTPETSEPEPITVDNDDTPKE